MAASLSNNTNLENENQIRIYPNPAKNQFEIETTSNIQDKLKSIQIYNLLGELIFSSNNYLKTIETSKFSSGVYIVKINCEDFEISKKLILN